MPTRKTAVLCRELMLLKHSAEFEELKRLACGLWSCELCAPGLLRDLKFLARSGEPTTFLTLTVRHVPGQSPLAHYKRLMRAWCALRKRIRRYIGDKEFEYVWVVEATQSGIPHLHILARMPFIPKAWLSAQMAELLDSPVVDIKYIRGPKQAVSYVTKYIAKAPARFGRNKRYFASRGYDRRAKDENDSPCIADGFAFMGMDIRYREYVHSKVCQGYYPELVDETYTRLWKPGYYEPHLNRLASATSG